MTVKKTVWDGSGRRGGIIVSGDPKFPGGESFLTCENRPASAATEEGTGPPFGDGKSASL